MRGSAGEAGPLMARRWRAARLGGGLLAWAVTEGWDAVAGRDEGDLVAGRGQCLLVVADKVLAVALVPLLVVVLLGIGIVLAVLHDRPGDADQGVAHRDGGFVLMPAAEPVGQAPEPGPGPGAGAGGGPGRRRQRRAQVPVALAGRGVLALARGFVVAGASPAQAASWQNRGDRRLVPGNG